MALLRMLTRATFICNICFVLAIGILRYRQSMNADPALMSIIIVMGIFLAILLNIAVHILLLIRRLQKKPVTDIPRWLLYTNGGFLAIQLILLFK